MRSVEIIGFSSDRRNAPLDQVCHEVWGLNQLYRGFDIPWTRWFEMHDLEFLEKWDPEYVAWLKVQHGPIYMQKRHDSIPGSVEFPRELVNADLGRRFGFSRDYFTSSFSYMLALAIHENFHEIGLYGIALIMDGEATYERPGLEYLIGIAQGAGIKVTMGADSPLLKIHYVYGYTEPRMKLSDVKAVLDFLAYSKSIAQQNLDRLEPLYDEEKDKQHRALLGTALVTYGAQKSLLDDLWWWLKHYGRGGNLIAPDGSLTK